MDGLGELLDRATGPGDLATILLAGTAGLVLDAGLNIVGFFSPAYVGLTFASTALGVKKAYEANANRRIGASFNFEVLERAERLKTLFEAEDRHDLVKALERELKLFRAGVLEPIELARTLAELTARYRAPSIPAVEGSVV